MNPFVLAAALEGNHPRRRDEQTEPAAQDGSSAGCSGSENGKERTGSGFPHWVVMTMKLRDEGGCDG